MALFTHHAITVAGYSVRQDGVAQLFQTSLCIACWALCEQCFEIRHVVADDAVVFLVVLDHTHTTRESIPCRAHREAITCWHVPPVSRDTAAEVEVSAAS